MAYKRRPTKVFGEAPKRTPEWLWRNSPRAMTVLRAVIAIEREQRTVTWASLSDQLGWKDTSLKGPLPDLIGAGTVTVNDGVIRSTGAGQKLAARGDAPTARRRDTANQGWQGQRAAYEAELDARTGVNQGPGAAQRHPSNSRYDWRKPKKGPSRLRFEESQPEQGNTPASETGSTPAPRPNRPGLLFGGRGKSMDEMRQQRRTDNGV